MTKKKEVAKHHLYSTSLDIQLRSALHTHVFMKKVDVEYDIKHTTMKDHPKWTKTYDRYHVQEKGLPIQYRYLYYSHLKQSKDGTVILVAKKARLWWLCVCILSVEKLEDWSCRGVKWGSKRSDASHVINRILQFILTYVILRKHIYLWQPCWGMHRRDLHWVEWCICLSSMGNIWIGYYLCQTRIEAP